ncbi:MAG: tyrosine-type recombinase/integrase [Candidatus Binatia bacterium]
MGVLRTRMIEEMRLRNFAPTTQKSYLYAVARLAKHYKRGPDQLDKEQIRSYLLYLTAERNLSPNTMNGFIAGLRFFYNETLGWEETKLFIPPRKKSSPLPEVLSPSEVVRLMDAARGLKQRVLLMTTYSAGLRVSELVHLKIRDIDSERMMIRVEQGKGRKDRYTILSQNLLTELRLYWKRYRPCVWLFPNRAKNGPLSRGEAWHIFNQAKKRAGLKKGRGIHTLRSCFATHLLEAGVDLRTIQLLMGHSSILSTQRYLRLRQQTLGSTVSPLDLVKFSH